MQGIWSHEPHSNDATTGNLEEALTTESFTKNLALPR